MRRLPWLCDRLLLPYRLARARAAEPFIHPDEAGTPVRADMFRCGFPEGDAAYNGIGVGPDGRIHFAISTKSLNPARLFVFDPRTERLDRLADLGDAFPSSSRTIPHGKVHVDLAPVGDRLYGATHVGFYEPGAATERPGEAAGYASYPGGWFFAIADGRVLACAQAPAGEGVIAMTVDADRGRAFGLTWPGGRLLCLDLASNELCDHGPVSGGEEYGSTSRGDWRRVCRSLAVHPPTGDVYWSDTRGVIWRLAGSRVDAVAQLPIADIWRKVCWDPGRRLFHGWTWRESMFFTFDAAAPACRAIETQDGVATRRPGTLAFAIDAEGLLHVLTRGPGLLRSRQIQLAETVGHVTVDPDSGATTRRGPLVTNDGTAVTEAQSLLLSGGYAYAVAWVEVPAADRSPDAAAVRAHRRSDIRYRTRGYAETIALIRLPIGRA